MTAATPSKAATEVAVLIAGGGPVGLTLALRADAARAAATEALTGITDIDTIPPAKTAPPSSP
jgi:hypothetical protein